MPTLFTTVVLVLSLTCLPAAWDKPPAKSQKGNIVAPPSAEHPGGETISGFLPSASGMEANLASTLFSGLWTCSTHECCFPPTFQPLHKCQYCAKTCLSKGGLANHENSRKTRSRTTPPNEPSSSPSVSPSCPGDADRDEQLLQDEEAVLNQGPPLTLAECSRLVSAYIEHPEWQVFLDSGRHATIRTPDVKTGWSGLRLDTVRPADRETPFPALTAAALETLTQLSPFINRLYNQLQTGTDPLADRDDLRAFIKTASQGSNEQFVGGNHSLVIKWRKGPGYVFKIARSRQDCVRLNREQNFYLWLRDPGNALLNLTTTPMRAAFSVSGKPVLALRQVDATARDRLLLMGQHHSLNERLDFALSVIFHFCQMYRRFLEKDVLLADRHDDNIGFNEIPLQVRKNTSLDEVILQVPVMLDLDPYWFGNQESRMIQLHLPAWVPVVTGLLEGVFTPLKSDSQISQSRVTVIDQLRQFASPVFPSSSDSAFPKIEQADRESALQSCTDHWFQAANQEYSELLAEARSHIEPLLNRLNQWDSSPRTVTEWNKKLQQEMGVVFQWLNNWRKETRFSLMKDFTNEGIIRIPGPQGTTSPREKQILSLLSMIHGKLGCQTCSRTFATITEFRKHWQLHQHERLQHCKVCGGDFSNITVHEQIHTEDKPYKCPLCERCFARSRNLKDHLHVHSGDKPYKCEHCGRCFSASSNLKRHVRTHSGDKPYQCQHCGRHFSQTITLKRHLHTHSGEKPCKCEHCGKCFSQPQALSRHLRIHTGEKPYQCQDCGKCFYESSHLKTHLRTHSGVRPYKCQNCGKCFSDSSNLSAHLRTHSGGKP